MADKDCPNRGELKAYLDGGLSDQRAEWLSAHLESCTNCMTAMETLNSADDPLIAALRQPVENAHERDPQYQALIARAKKLGPVPPARGGTAAPPVPTAPAGKAKATPGAHPAKPGTFDPYYQWLGIPAKDQPPNHYRLLGVDRFESNADVIDNAAEMRTMLLRAIQTPEQVALAQKLLNEVVKAKVCLLQPAAKAAYDQKLKQQAEPTPAAPSAAPPPVSPSKPAAKNRLGEYQLLAKLGEGGMGTVYKALHTKLGKTVALKVLAKGNLFNDEAIARFEREMKAVGQLNHPNIVQALDAREIGGTRFLVMELVDGKDLGAIVKGQGPLPVVEGVNYMVQAARGLQYAHQQGVVHRDIKPANLLLDKQGIIKISDMGLARIVAPTNEEPLTARGQVMGTCDYMAPEQAHDTHQADQRSDIYSLGCTLYRLLTGEVPYKRDTLVSTLMAHRDAPIPSLRKARAEVPPQLDVVFRKMVAKQPKDRQQSMAEVIADLEKCAIKAEPAAVPPAATPPASASQDNASFVAQAPAAGVATAAEKKAGRVAEATINQQAAADTSHQLGIGDKLLTVARRKKILVGSIGAGLVGMAAVGLLTVMIHVKRPDGTETTVAVPNGSAVKVSEKGDVEVTLKGSGTRGQGPVNDQQPPFSRSGRGAGGEGTSPPLAIAPFDAEKAKEHQAAWAKHLGVPAEETNSIGMKLALIPPGEFEMGSSSEEIQRTLEESKKRNVYVDFLSNRVPGEVPRHRVQISKPFYLATYVITQAEYEKIIGINPSAFAGKQGDLSALKLPLQSWVVQVREKGSLRMAGKDTGRYPVEIVNWTEAVEFCRELSARPAERAARRVYRLPTEAEWEYACRAGTASRWYCGDDEAKSPDCAWLGQNADMMTHPVGEKLPNAWGLYDMYGNVWQMCADCFIADYYQQSPPRDPTGPADGTCRVTRGGSFYDTPSICRSALRNCTGPDSRNHNLGFRVVAEIPAAGAGASAAAAETAVAEPADGWRPLFDGHSLDDWHIQGNATWTIADGAICGGGDENGVLLSQQEFVDFELQADAKINAAGNSGVFFRITPNATTRYIPGIVNSYEIQVIGSEKQSAGGYPHTGDLFHFANVPENHIQDDQWFHLRLVASSNHILVEIDGQSVLDYVDARNSFTRGSIGFQKWGRPTRVSYRNIRVRELGGARSSAAGVAPVPATAPSAPASTAEPNVLKLDHAKITFRPELSMLPFPVDHRDSSFPLQTTDDPCGPLAAKPVYFDQHTGRDVVYDVETDQPIRQVRFRGAAMWNMQIEALDRQGKTIAKAGPFEGGNRWAEFNLSIPDGTPLAFRLRVHDEAGDWFFIDRLELRPQPAAAPELNDAKAPQQECAKQFGVPAQIANSIGMKLALVPPGTSYQAWAEGRVLEPVYIGVYKVTQDEYSRVMGVNPSNFSTGGKDKDKVAGVDTHRYPVDNVTWFDAAEFCNRLSQREGLPPYYRIEGDTVRFTGARSYCIPSFIARCRAAYAAERAYLIVDPSRVDDYCWDWGPLPLHPVGQKLSTAYGLFDMFGNGFEFSGSEGWTRGAPLSQMIGSFLFTNSPSDYTYGGNRQNHNTFRVMKIVDKEHLPAPLANFDDAAERSAVQWALAAGANVHVVLDGQEWTVKTADDLPQSRMRVAWLDFQNALTDQDLGHLRGLTALHSFYCRDSAELTETGLGQLAELSSLQRLNLNNTPISDAGLDRLARLPDLRALSFNSTQVTEAGLASLAKCVSLEDLGLGQTAATDATLEHLRSLKNLRVLSLANTAVSSAGLRHLQNFPELSNLRLDAAQVTGEGLQCLAPLQNLRELYLCSLAVGDEDLARLPNRKSLVRLWLANTQVTDQGLKCLRECGQLNALCLNGVGPGITDAALPGLADISTLGEIALQGTNVTAAGVIRFKAKLPRCKVSLSNEVQDEIDQLLQKSAAISSTVAPWVFSVGGRLEVQFANGDRRWVTSAPNGPFQITRIQLGNKDNVTDQDCARLRGLQLLLAVDLSNTGTTDETLKVLAELPNLEEVQLRGGPYTDAGVAYLGRLKHAKRLVLDCDNLTDEALNSLCDLESLEQISLCRSHITGQGLACLARLPRLKRLLLNNTEVDDAHLEDLAKLTSLEELHVAGTRVTGATLDRLRPLKNLRVLALWDTAVSNAGLRELQNLPRLVDLSLAGTQITGDGFECLAPLVRLRRLNLDRTTVGNDDLPRLPNRGSLVALWLGNTQVTDHGLKYLRECANLRELHLNGLGSQITDAGLGELVEIPALQSLDLHGTNVTAAAAAQFKAKVPRCNFGLDKDTQDELEQLLKKP